MSASSLIPVTGSTWQGVRYGCTTRAGGVSREPWGPLNLGLHVGDDVDHVMENRERLSQQLPQEPYWLDQVHGTTVVTVKAGPKPQTPPQADAAVTLEPGVVLAIMTADCLPVVIADVDGRALGVAHAGWRGLAAGVLEKTFTALQSLRPQSQGWRAWVGPCIGLNNFEVGEEVRAAFLSADDAVSQYFSAGIKPGKWQADLAGLARHRLERIAGYGVEVSGLCTYDCDKLFHSYRRSRVCGRMATVAWLES